MYESSSRKRRDYDGQTSIYCRECGQFITKSPIRMDNKAVCAICERILSGDKTLTAEAIQEYEKNKIAQLDVTMVNMSKYDKLPGTFKLRTMGDRLMQAFGIKQPPKPELESTKIAKAKRRSRIFADVTPDGQPEPKANLGSITELDKELERQRQKL